MISAPKPASDRLLAAIGAYRKALMQSQSDVSKPDPQEFAHALSQVEAMDFFSSIGGEAAKLGTVDHQPVEYRGTMTLDSDAVARGDTSIENAMSTVDSESGSRPDELEKTKLPGQYETQGVGDFSMGEEDLRDPSPSMSIDRLTDYELLSELGRGGMGVVYKARQKALNRIVALKMVLSGGRASKQQLARFTAEARAVARLDHPNIVQVYDIGEHDGLPFFAMEFVEGGALDSAVKKQSMEAIAAARMMETVCRAMHYAHTKGVIHRDLKPANILLMTSSSKSSILTKTTEKSQAGTGVHSALRSTISGPAPKITDFGLAKQLDDENDAATRSGAVMGTPNYMAPEQAEGNTKDVNHLADVYSLGATLYELITGRPPFQGPSVISVLSLVRSADPVNPSRLQPNIPKDLETICLKAMQKEPIKRYESAEAMADDLARFIDGQPILARPISSVEKAGSLGQRKPREAGLWLSAAGLAASIIAVFIWSDLRVRDKNVEIASKNTALSTANTEIANTNTALANERDAVVRQSDLTAKQLHMLRDLSAELKALGLTKQREKLITNALIGIREMERMNKDSKGIVDRGQVSAAIQIAEFHEELGKAERDLDSFRKAEDYYAKAVSMAEKLAEADPQSDLARGNYALALGRLGMIRLQLNKQDGTDGAPTLIDRAMTLRKEIVESPKSPAGTRDYLFPADRLMSLADSHIQKATLAGLRSEKETVRFHQKEALSLREKALEMAKADPSTSEEPLKLAPIQSAVSQSLLIEAAELSAEAGLEKDKAKSDTMRKQAQAILDRALTTFERAVEENAESLPFKKNLSTILWRVGVNQLIEKKYAEARVTFDRTYTIRDQILKQGDESASMQNRWDASTALYGVGTANVKLGERAKGMSAFRECLRLREKLMADNDNPMFVRGVMTAAARTGDHAKAMRLIASEESREPKRMTPLFLFDTACTASIAAHAVGNWADDSKLSPDQKALRQKYLDTAWKYVELCAKANPGKAREIASDPDCEFLQSQPGFQDKLKGILDGNPAK